MCKKIITVVSLFIIFSCLSANPVMAYDLSTPEAWSITDVYDYLSDAGQSTLASLNNSIPTGLNGKISFSNEGIELAEGVSSSYYNQAVNLVIQYVAGNNYANEVYQLKKNVTQAYDSLSSIQKESLGFSLSDIQNATTKEILGEYILAINKINPDYYNDTNDRLIINIIQHRTLLSDAFKMALDIKLKDYGYNPDNMSFSEFLQSKDAQTLNEILSLIKEYREKDDKAFADIMENLSENVKVDIPEIRQFIISFDTTGEYISKYNKMSASNRSAADMYIRLAIEGDNGGSLINTVCSMVKVSQTHANIINSIAEWIYPIGFIILIIMLVMEINNEVTMRFKEFDLKALCLILLRFMISCIVVGYSGYLTSVIMWISNALIDKILNTSFASGNLEGSITYVKAVIDYFSEASWLDRLVKNLTATFVDIGNSIPVLFISFHAIARQIELCFRGSLIPWAMADSISGGINSNGVKFFKKFAACLFSGFLMVGVCKVASMLSASNTINITTAEEFGSASLGTFFQMIIYNWAAVGMLSSAKQIMNDLLGV